MSSIFGYLPIIDLKRDTLENLNLLFGQYGFVRIDNVFNEEEISEMQSAMTTIVDGMKPEEHPKVIFTSDEDPKNARDVYFLDSSDKIRFFYEDGVFNEDGELTVEKGKAINKVGHALHWLNPVFKKYSFHENIKSIARWLDFIDPIMVQSMYIFKQPNIGGPVHEHFDSSYLRMEPNNKLIGVWIAIDDATIENGCLWFIPGSHKNNESNYRFVRNQDHKDPSDPLLVYTGEKPEYETDKFIPVPVPRGSLVLIEGLVVHKSERNTSNISRHAYTFHIAENHENKWSPLNWLQETPSYEFQHLYKNINE